MKQFATVHCHPASLDSASTVRAFAKREADLGSPALVCTDHGTLQAAHQVYDWARSKKWPDGDKRAKPPLIPVVGLEAYFRDDSCPILQKLGIPRTDTVPKGSDKEEWARRYPGGTYIDYAKYYHITLHFMDEAAYLCAVRLLSKADLRAEQHGSERKPLFDWADMEELAGHNVTATSSCLVGIVQRHLVGNDNHEAAAAYYQRMKHLFGDRFYVEVFPHACTHDFVKAVFVDVATVAEDGTKTDEETLRFNWRKKLRTEGAEEVYAEDLAEQDPKQHGKLVAHSHYRKWYDYENPRTILAVRKEEGFIENECRPWCEDTDVQKGCNKFVLELARRDGVPVVIGDDSHFAVPDDKIVQDVRLAQQGPWRFHGSYHRQSSQEAFNHFEATLGTTEKEFEGWVENSHAWAERFKGFKLDATPSLPTKFYPKDTLAHTKTLIEKHGRLDKKNPVELRRLKTELDLVHRTGMDLLPYFMIDEEVCGLFEAHGYLTGPGRGSAAGLRLAYLLGITHTDPLKWNLSLERFMTPDRIKSGALPDIDQDLPLKWREPLLLDPENGWLKKRFGDHYAQISVDTTLKLKNAVLDVVRAKHGWVPPQVQDWTKRFEKPPQGLEDSKFVLGYTDDAGVKHQGSMERDRALMAFIEAYPEEWEIVKKCLGLARQKGRHACAYVIADKPIHEFIPLTTVSGVRVTSFTAPAVEAVGGLKMDFLGLGALDDIGDAIQLIQERHGHLPDLERYPLLEHEEAAVGWSGPRFTDKRFSLFLAGKRVPSQRLVPRGADYVDIWDLPEDQEVFREVAGCKTETVFQFNTPGARKWLKHFDHVRLNGNAAIDSVEAMAAFTALDRPGPLNIEVMNPDWEGDEAAPEAKHNMLVEYARRARGATPSPEVLQVLDDLVPETFGVMTYQEQMQRVYQELTGCSGPEAEEFRRNVAKKKKEKVDAAYPGFIERAGAKYGEEQAKKLWQFLETWAEYGFNKSHAVCYAIIAYACAYLKHHYPLEWWTAVLRNADKKEVNEKFWPHVGHLVLLPDVQHSKAVWTIEGDKIRAPLDLIKGIGETAHAQLAAGAPYRSIDDFVEKIKAHREATATLKERAKKGKNVPEGTMETVRVLGRTAIHRGIVHTLIVSGAMASLFPPGAPDDQCLDLYEQAMKRVFGKAAGKPKAYPKLDPLGRYQARKKVIQAWGTDLRPVVVAAGLPDHLKVIDGKRMRFLYEGWDGRRRGNVPMEDPVVGLARVEAINEATSLPEGGMRCAVLAYVEESTELLYQGKRKKARKLLLDIGGAKFEFVHWPPYGENAVPEHVAQCKAGSIVTCLLFKKEVDREFAVRELRVVRGPLTEEKEEEPDGKHPEPAAAD